MATPKSRTKRGKCSKSFDDQLNQYIKTTYVQSKYQTLLGCSDVDLVNTTALYARFTTSVICNSIVQNSNTECSLTGDAVRPLCADSCADFAESEAYIAADGDLCSNPTRDVMTQIKADFQDCVVPADSLSSAECIRAIDNEPTNCGYGTSVVGLCSYCASGGINSTDTCCYNSDAESRCADVVLPTIAPSMSFSTPTPTPTPSDGATTPDPSEDQNDGLSGGAIAGIVIGSIAGVALLLVLLFFCIRIMRRRQSGGSQKGSIFNQPAPSRQGPQVSKIPAGAPSPGFEVLPGGRIARMSALEGNGGAHSKHGGSRHDGSTSTATGGSVLGYMTGRRRADTRDNQSSSDDFGESPQSDIRAGVLRPPPTNRRNGSLSSGSILIGEDPQSPSSGGGMSSPPGVASQQSEQLPFFKDYYSQDDIHPGERVAVLWAYQPRAADEFTLDRGDMLKVVGIWDDGWATGIMMDERADEWEARRQAQRDSGVSSTSARGRDPSPPVSGEIKAFPLVCVCLPEHWRKTIEGDGSTDATSSGHQGT
ncbi:putative sh3 domain-containing protein [Eutypa lata UCREL1]|uniref:Putative sh3 domain-containing protein n=1 Tax=Eutypa lata (strain UCR-EL1) TaxID=1287681 RepID=M7SQ41_EUTLA|nr:putative sh3 domain-containing protein [Eutypa lata UCREL1]